MNDSINGQSYVIRFTNTNTDEIITVDLKMVTPMIRDILIDLYYRGWKELSDSTVDSDTILTAIYSHTRDVIDFELYYPMLSEDDVHLWVYRGTSYGIISEDAEMDVLKTFKVLQPDDHFYIESDDTPALFQSNDFNECYNFIKNKIHADLSNLEITF